MGSCNKLAQWSPPPPMQWPTTQHMQHGTYASCHPQRHSYVHLYRGSNAGTPPGKTCHTQEQLAQLVPAAYWLVQRCKTCHLEHRGYYSAWLSQLQPARQAWNPLWHRPQVCHRPAVQMQALQANARLIVNQCYARMWAQLQQSTCTLSERESCIHVSSPAARM